MTWGSQARVGEHAARGEQSAWVLAHWALSRLAAERARTDVEEGRCLLAAWRARAHVHAGFGSFVEYVGQLFGYGPRLTHEKLRVGAALLAMARAVLGGPVDEGRASYQIGLSVCVRCGGGELPAAGQVVRVEPEVVAMACCDAEELGWVGAVSTASAGSGAADGTREPESDGGADATRARESDSGGTLAGEPSEVTEVPCELPSEETLAKLEVGAHVGTRASRSIPRGVRRQVLHRDHRCCRVPGCRNTRFVDLHHLVPRCEGGRHTAQVLITLCGVHHRAGHRGELVIEGTSVNRVQFLHPDGTPYGGGLNAAMVDAQAKVFSALRNLGFSEKQVRPVLGALREDPSTRRLEVGPLMRQALERLGPLARVQ